MGAPMRIGILDDMATGAPGVVQTRWLRFAVDELIASGRLDREVEFVHAYGQGLPTGTAAAVEHAFAALVDQDVLMILGPAIGDNALVATPLAERFGVPTLNWAGTERARGDLMFHLQVGSHEDESILLARHLAGLGARRVGVIYDRSPIGRRHLSFLDAEADILGLRISTAAPISPLAEEAAAPVSELLETGSDAVVYLGLGLAAAAVARDLQARGWSGPRCMNTAGIRGYDPAFARVVDGWTYVDMHADDNLTLAGLRRRSGAGPEQSYRAAQGYDLGRLAAEGLARAPERTRRGVRDGLEQVKWLAAAEGEEGTLLGFGVHERAALHGRYLVLRQWVGGTSVQVARTRP